MADKYVEDTLESWGMGELVTNFNDEGIDEEAFNILDDDTVKQLIPKAGLRLKFRRNYNILMNAAKIQNWLATKVKFFNLLRA